MGREGNLANAICNYLQLRDPRDYKPNFHHFRLKTYLRHVRVSYDYLKNKDGKPIVRTRTINGLSMKNASQMTFELDDPKTGVKKKKSVEQYFMEQHGRKLQSNALPVINIGNNERPVWLPAEFATIVRGQPFMGKLPDQQTAQMINFACKPPKENALSIERTGIPKLGLAGTNADLVSGSIGSHKCSVLTFLL